MTALLDACDRAMICMDFLDRTTYGWAAIGASQRQAIDVDDALTLRQLGRSIGVFRYLVAPAVRELLAAGLRPRARDWLLAAFELLYNALWLCPAYVISLVVNALWCGSHGQCTLDY